MPTLTNLEHLYMFIAMYTLLYITLVPGLLALLGIKFVFIWNSKIDPLGKETVGMVIAISAIYSWNWYHMSHLIWYI